MERDLRVRYKQTVLGFGWSVVGPVTFMIVFTLFFSRAGHINTGGAPYPLFSYIALVPWTFFSEALTLGSMSLITNLTLLNKVYCPREVFPIATIVSAAFDALVSTLVLFVLFAISSLSACTDLPLGAPVDRRVAGVHVRGHPVRRRCAHLPA